MKNVTDMYPLSPMQEVMLLHAVSSGGDDTLFNQFTYEVDGPLDRSAFREAWQGLVDRHPVLRSAFVWENLRQPLQVVRTEATLPIVELDWRGYDAARQQAELSTLQREDRARPFALQKAPLMRLTLVRLADERTAVLWSSHHLLIDRWCLSTVFEELFELYDARREGRPPRLGPPGRFRDYVAWIQAQDPGDAERFWRDALHGFETPTRLTERPSRMAGRGDEGPDGEGPARDRANDTIETNRVDLSETTSESLRRFARAHGLTQSTVFQGAWALLLNRRLGASDVVFGAVVSGRPPALPGVERMLGSFINNLPVRARLWSDLSLGEWLRAQQRAQHARLAFEHVAPTRIQAWSDLPPSESLFDHLLVWLSPHSLPAPEGLVVHTLPGALTTAFPLTVAVAEDRERLGVIAYLDRRRGEVDAHGVLEDLRETLETVLAADPDRPLGELPGFRGELRRPAPAEPTDDRRARPVVVSTASAGPRANGDSRPSDASEPHAAGREALETEMLEDLLLEEWRRTLDTHEIEPDVDFFRLGGTSLLAVQLHGRIEAATRMAVPLLALFQDPTLRGMASTLQEREWPLAPGIVLPLQTRGAREPLFCVASPEVNTIGYSLVARHLAADQPVYVLQTPPTQSRPRRLDPSDLLALAQDYVDAMTEIRPGPYQLLGMCSGAHIALEMASRLERAGERVSFLGIVNTWAFHTRSRLYRVELFRQRLAHYARRIGSIARMERSERPSALRALAGRKIRGARRTAQGSVAEGAVTRGTGTPPSQANPWLDEVGWARGDVERTRVSAPITVFRIAKQQAGRIRDRHLGWGNHTSDARVRDLPAEEHDDILREPHVRFVAEALQACLEPRENRRTS